MTTIMNLKNKENTNNYYTIEVELNPEEMLRGKNMAYLKNRHMFISEKFPGKRGSMALIERSYPGVFDQAAIKELEEEIVDEVKNKVDEDILVGPSIVNIEVNEPATTVRLAYFTKPELDYPEFVPLEEDVPQFKVSNKELRSLLNEKREENVRLIPKEGRAKKGDVVNVDFLVNIDGKALDFNGENQNLTVGRPVDGSLTDGYATGDEKLLNGVVAGDTVALETIDKDRIEVLAQVNQVYQREVPKLNDEFASEVSEYDTLKEYRDYLKEELAEQKRSDFINKHLEDSFIAYLRKVFSGVEGHGMFDLLNDQRRAMFQYMAVNNLNGGVQGALPQLVYDYNYDQFKRVLDELIQREGLEITEDEARALKRILENPMAVHDDLFGFKPLEIKAIVDKGFDELYPLSQEEEVAAKYLKLLGLLKERD